MVSDGRWRSLGTEGRHVEIVAYRPAWPEVFTFEAAAILEACRLWITEVHHIGSTSVPGLAAKPVLDMMPVAANPDDGATAVPNITALGYRYRGENGIPGRFYFDRIVDGRTVAHVHMYPAGHPEVWRRLAFRDHLRAHPEVARDYERVKRALASRYREDRRSYTERKAEFVNCVIASVTGSSASARCVEP